MTNICREGAQRMTIARIVALIGVLTLAASPARAQISDGVVKIGVLNDQSSLYADLAGQGSVVAARMAVEDYGATAKGLKVEIVFADHQNKADVGSQLARQWYDAEKVDLILDVPNSGVALAVNQITRDKGKAFIVSSAASSDLTGKACSPNTIHWTYDTWALANGTGNSVVKTGGDTWFFLTDVHALGLEKAQGLTFTETFYWDLNEKTRAFAKRFAERNRGIHPTMIHAGVYAGTLHYLKAVEALKSDEGAKVIAKMKELPTDDPLFGKGTIRVDGRKIHPAYLVEVKKPAESKYPWDYYKIRATIPAEQAFRPLDQGGCELVKK